MLKDCTHDIEPLVSTLILQSIILHPCLSDSPFDIFLVIKKCFRSGRSTALQTTARRGVEERALMSPSAGASTAFQIPQWFYGRFFFQFFHSWLFLYLFPFSFFLFVFISLFPFFLFFLFIFLLIFFKCITFSKMMIYFRKIHRQVSPQVVFYGYITFTPCLGPYAAENCGSVFNLFLIHLY